MSLLTAGGVADRVLVILVTVLVPAILAIGHVLVTMGTVHVQGNLGIVHVLGNLATVDPHRGSSLVSNGAHQHFRDHSVHTGLFTR